MAITVGVEGMEPSKTDIAVDPCTKSAIPATRQDAENPTVTCDCNIGLAVFREISNRHIPRRRRRWVIYFREEGAVAIHISGGNLHRARSSAIVMALGESPVAISKRNRDGIGGPRGDSDVLPAVAVEVARCDRLVQPSCVKNQEWSAELWSRLGLIA